MLLAAGFGTRLKPYTDIRPKPLFPVLNRPLLLWHLERLRQAGFARVLVNAHHLAGQIERAVAGLPGVQLQVEPEILGTGGSLREALPRLAAEPLLVLNGDVYHELDLAALWAQHLQSTHAVTMALHDLPRFNTVQVQGRTVSGFGRAAGALAFTGIQVVNPEIIARIPVARFFHIIDLYRQMAPLGCIGYARVDGVFWQDMGTPADYLDLHRRLLGPGAWRIAETARAAGSARLAGFGCIGERAVIAPGATLSDCVVWDGASIPQGCYRQRILTGDPRLDSQTQGGFQP